MNEIIRHLEYLLVANDCVVIPGLGAVIAHTVSAKVDEDGCYITAPSRTFSFNSMLTHNDGMLSASLARARAISFEVARNIITNEVEQMRRELAAKGRLALGCVGALIMTDGILSFEPGRSDVLSPATMWFPQLRLRHLGDITREREAIAEAGNRKKGHILTYATRIGRIAASLVLLLALGAVLSTPIDVENAQYASFGIENFRPAEKTDSSKASLIRRPGEMSSSLVLVINRFDDAMEIADTAAHNEYIRVRQSSLRNVNRKSEASDLRFDENDRYCLVVASLASEAEAQKYIEQSRGARLGILAKDGRYRIYAATEESLRQAHNTANVLSERYPGVWVCRK